MSNSSGPQSTHPLPSHGNGKLIAVGVIMLLAAGGLVIWKLQSKSSEPEAVAAPVATTAPVEEAPVALDNAPPPPPEEEEEVTPVEQPKSGSTASAAKFTGPAGCNDACNGTATPALQSALGSRGAMARSCYMTALRMDPTLKGKMTMNVTVSPTGAVCSASASNNTLGNQAVASCAAAKFMAGKFPPPTGGCVNVAVPLNFSAK